MKMLTQAGIHVQCQKNRTLDFTQRTPSCRDGRMIYSFDWEDSRGSFELVNAPDVSVGRLHLELSQQTMDANDNLALEKPVVLKLHLAEKPEKITAMYLFNDWWTRPAFISGFSQIPARTQVAFLKYPDRCACLVPAVGESYKAYLAPGGPDWFSLELTAGMGGQSGLDEPVFFLAEDQSIYGAVEKVFRHLAREKGVRTRQERRFPDMFRYLGWCSWDAFYTDISEEKVREKARELREKNVPVRWILMDDGWLSTEDGRLYDFAPEKAKFPAGFSGMIEDIKREGSVAWFGVWHALGGYWGGILPGSPLERQEREHLYDTPGGKILPHPQKERGFGFYGDWYACLREQGIDFVKVDGQSAVKNYFENSVPLCRAARGLHDALEGAASRLDGTIINCMGMAMENILARPASALSRSSDDFVPARENGFGEHLLQNAYNALYQGQLYHCDWDMFWTSHPDAAKHSLLRAVSGGPVYVSDKIGETSPEALKPLVCLDGRLLMMDRPAWPTEDCVFADPMKDGVLKLTNTAKYGGKKAGGIAAFNLTETAQTCTFTPLDVPELSEPGRFLVYDWFGKAARICGGTDKIKVELEPGGFAWYQVLPMEGEALCLGLSEKYVGFAAVEAVCSTQQGMTCVLAEQGPVSFACAKKPGRVLCNGAEAVPLPAEESKNSDLGIYVIDLPPEKGKTVLEVLWD